MTGADSASRGLARVVDAVRRLLAPAAPRGGRRDRPTAVYDPRDDDRADPGEIVWGWVPFEDDPARGKDRPVLIIGRDGADLLGLYLSSQDHDRDADEARHGRYWMDIGRGAWDPRGRPSEVRLDRVVRLSPGGVRRIGAALDRATFDRVTAASQQRTRDRSGSTRSAGPTRSPGPAESRRREPGAARDLQARDLQARGREGRQSR